MIGKGVATKSAWLDQKVELLRQLANSLQAAQDAVVRDDLAELRGQTSRQQLLCGQIRQLAGEPMVKFGPENWETEKRRRELQDKLARTELEVARLNRVYGALLRRASRTVNIFCRVLAACGATYEVPQSLTIASGSQKE